jgi:GT2 family glycosyltransferase
MDVSIIIVSYNTKDLLYNCIESIYKQTKNINFEIIVSDNGSKDGSVEIIRKDFPDVIIIENNLNLGFGAANNRAAQFASGTYLFFLNSDTIILNNAVLMFYEKAKKDNLSLVGCLLSDGDGNIIHSAENFATPFKSCIRMAYHFFPSLRKIKLFFRKDKFLSFEDVVSNKKVDYITGADLFIASEVFRMLSGFDENFFMYFEDDDICRRACLYGYGSYIVAGPEIMHLGGGSTIKTVKMIMIEEGSYFVYMKKYNRRLNYFLIRTIYFFWGIIRLFSFQYSFLEKIKLFKSTMRTV